MAAQAASSQAEHTPQVTEATEAVSDAHDARQVVTGRQQRERLALLSRLCGRENVWRDPVRYQVTNSSREVRRWQAAADRAGAEADRLRALAPAEAARQITAGKPQPRPVNKPRCRSRRSDDPSNRPSRDADSACDPAAQPCR
ncbi:MAG: hypothetical protein ACREQM_07915 [Candidatus Dormibacteraceae bacterium]